MRYLVLLLLMLMPAMIQAHDLREARIDVTAGGDGRFQAALTYDIDALVIGGEVGHLTPRDYRSLSRLGTAEINKGLEEAEKFITQNLRIMVDGRPLRYTTSFPEFESDAIYKSVPTLFLENQNPKRRAILSGMLPADSNTIQIRNEQLGTAEVAFSYDGETWLRREVIADAQTTKTFPLKQGKKARLILPRGTDTSALRIIAYSDEPSVEENHAEPVIIHNAVDANGEFAANLIPEDTAILEFAGPGLRRARFPYEKELFQSEEERPVFRLNEGTSTKLIFIDDSTEQPIAGVIVGSVTPGETAPREVSDRSFGFFERSDAEGVVRLDGLVEGVDYRLPIYAEGYRRTVSRVTVGTEETITIRLSTGGALLSGTAVGVKSGDKYPNTLVLLTGGPSSFHIYQRTNANGEFNFSGLPDGAYSMVPVVEADGDRKPTEFIVANQRSRTNFILPVFEGIRIAGTVVDADTLTPIAGALVYLREETALTNAEGAFAFDNVMGPWPARLDVQFEGFIYDPQIQSEVVRDLNGYDEDDILNISVELSRERFLQLTTNEVNGQAFLELYGPLALIDAAEKRESITELETTIPMARAGTYVARLFDLERSTRFETIRIPADVRTTPVTLNPGPGAQLELDLRYTDGTPVDGVIVELVSFFGQSEVTWKKQELRNGKLVLPALAPGDARLLVYTKQDVSLILRDLTFVAGERITISEELERGEAFRGVAVTAEGAPVSGLTFTAYGYSAKAEAVNVTAVTDREGRFVFEGLMGPMLEELRLDHQEFMPVALTEVRFPEDEFRVQLQPRPMIKITVPEFSQPQSRAEVYVLSGQKRTEGSIIDQWYFSLVAKEDLIQPGTHVFRPIIAGTLQVAAREGSQWAISEPFDWKSDKEHEFTLRPANNASLSLRFEDEINPESIEVTLANTSIPDDTTDTAFNPTSRGRGRIDYQNIPPGMYLLVASNQEGRVFRETNLYLAQGAERRINLNFAQSLITVEGVVVNASDRQPVSGAKVDIMPNTPAPNPIDSTRTDGSGRFRFTYIPGNQPLLLDVTEGNRRNLFPVTPTGEAIAVQIPLTDPTPVAINLGGTLLADVQSGKALPPLVLQGTSTRTLMLRPNQELATELEPGKYNVMLGENLINVVEVPSQRQTFTINVTLDI